MITYRPALFEDLTGIIDIYNSTIASGMVTADTVPVSVASREAWFYEHDEQKRPLWVIEKSGSIAGWVSFQSFYNRPAYRHTAEISIYLHKEFRGKGIGNQVLQHCMDSCPQLEIKTLLGFIFAHNYPSINLFVKLGFQEWAMLPNIAEINGVERSLKIFGKRVLSSPLSKIVQ